MPASLPSFEATVQKLIQRFESDRTHYLSKSYSEAQARVDFITPFFKALVAVLVLNVPTRFAKPGGGGVTSRARSTTTAES